jgi:hypothetical protein
MGFMEVKRYPFSAEGVSNAPDLEGVYIITNRNLDPIYIGRGILREKLINHYFLTETIDECIWSNNPTHFNFKICSNSEERKRELLNTIPTACND